MMKLETYIEIKQTFDHMMNMRQPVAVIEARIKKAVLTINGKEPTEFDLSKLRLAFDDDEFIVSTWTKDFHATKAAVAEALAIPDIAVVKHTPTSADDIQVGDIYMCHWGATMALVDFFQVVKRTKCFVTLRQLATLDEHHDMFTGTSVPLTEFEDHSMVYDGERFEDDGGNVYAQRTIKIDPNGNGSPVLKYRDFMWCYPWDGKKQSFDHCD